MFCEDTKSQILFFLQETHSCENDSKLWKTQWGDKALFCHGTNHSAGVATLFNNFKGQIINSRYDLNGRWLITMVKISIHYYILVNVYGYNSHSQNNILHQELIEEVKAFKNIFTTAEIIIGGDLNELLDEQLDRHPTKLRAQNFNLLQNLCNDLSLIAEKLGHVLK